MGKPTEKAVRKGKQNRKFVLSLIMVLAFVAVGVLVFLSSYNSYIDKTLYAERLSQMREVTTQLFSGLEDVMNNQWRTADEQCRTLQQTRPKTLDALLSFMEDRADLGDLDSIRCSVVAIDESGMYYTQQGRQGLLAEREYLLNTPERVNYVTNSMISDETRMVFLKRLDTPVVIRDGEKEIKLTYFGISQNMEALNPYFECRAYNGSNSVYVVDSEGLKLFDSSRDTLLKGFNIYRVLSDMEYLHGSSFDEARKELESNGIAYSNAVIENTEVYYALYHMDNAEWTLIFLVPSRYVATNTVDLVNTTIRLVLIFAAVMIVASASAIFWLMRTQQKTALEIEHRNNEALARLNKELEAASRAKSEFLANMSHDIRTPMNAIVGITNLMAHEPGISDHLHTYISKVQMSSRHLLSLINDVLDMSKIESSEVKLNREPVSLAEIVGQIDSIIRSQTNERGQTFLIRVHTIKHEYVISDGVRLRQLLLNLLSNATKYTQIGGEIILELAELPCDAPGRAEFRISVIDNGYGMDPAFVSKMFEPFTREESSLTNKVQGTGLGMAITKSIVDLMGGDIRVTSEPGKGSRFDVTLTFDINAKADLTVNADTALLITEDETLRSNVAAAIQTVKIRFDAVKMPEEAMRKMAEQRFDVILLGGWLYDKNLAETVSALRSCAKGAKLIFCVDYAQTEQADRALAKSGADGLIPRPFFLANLIQAMGQKQEAAVFLASGNSVLEGLHFLCAEDNELNAEILEATLNLEGASCTICRNGRELVDTFAKVKPGEYDAILMDVQMPVMNGLEAAKAVRTGENPLGKTIPILAMTANAFAEDIQNSLAAGMNAHISKPLDIRVLEREMAKFGDLKKRLS